MTDQSATVARIRAQFPTPLGARHAEFLRLLAAVIQGQPGGAGAGLLRKSGGTTVTLPDGVTVAQDIICFPDGRIFDCLGDGEGAATPSWSEAEGSPVDRSRYYAVAGDTLPQPQPNPQPNPQPQPVPGLTLDRWVNTEIDQIVDAYHAKHGSYPSAKDIGFQAWRRLREGWAIEKLLSEL